MKKVPRKQMLPGELFLKLFQNGGSWMVPKKKVAEGSFDEIRAMVSEAAAIVKEIRG